MKFFRTYQFLRRSPLQSLGHVPGAVARGCLFGHHRIFDPFGYILGADLPRISKLSCNSTWRRPDWLAILRADDLVQLWAMWLSERLKGLDNGFQAHSAFSEPGHRLRSTAATLHFSPGLYHIRKGTVIISTSSPCLRCLSKSSPLPTPSHSSPHTFSTMTRYLGSQENLQEGEASAAGMVQTSMFLSISSFVKNAANRDESE